MSAQRWDDAYDSLYLDYRPARIFDTTRRVYRYVLLAPWRIGEPAVATDPDALLDDSEPLFRSQSNGGGKKGATTQHIIALLRECGPMSATHMGQRLGISRGAVKSALGNNLTTFRRVGFRDGYMLYDLAARE